MSYYALAQRTTSAVIGTAAWEIRAAAANKPRIIELGFTNTTNVSNEYSLGRPTAVGVTPTTPQAFVTESDSTAGTANTTGAVAWGTAPVSPAFFNRRGWASLTGAGIIWTFPRGLDIPPGTSMVLWNSAANGVVDTWAVIDE